MQYRVMTAPIGGPKLDEEASRKLNRLVARGFVVDSVTISPPNQAGAFLAHYLLIPITPNPKYGFRWHTVTEAGHNQTG